MQKALLISSRFPFRIPILISHFGQHDFCILTSAFPYLSFTDFSICSKVGRRPVKSLSGATKTR